MLRARKNRRRVDQAAVRQAATSLFVRTVKGIAVIAGLVLVMAVSAYGAAWGRAWLTTSPTFAIEKLEFIGVTHANEDELARVSGIVLGDNLFQADLPAAEKAMAAHPWVRRVAVEREYPRTLVVRVIEHEPAALADLGGLYFVSAQGKAFKKLAAGEEADLPLLTGVGRDEYTAHEEETEALFREALAAVEQYRELGTEKKAALSEVRVNRLEGLTFFVGKDAMAVRVGTGEYRDKFARLEQLFAELARRGARAEVIRLDNRTRPGWVAVQLAQGGGEIQ